MKVHLIVIVLSITGQMGLTQSHTSEAKFSYEIESDLAEGKIGATRAGLLYSLIGDYRNSTQYSDIPVSWGVDTLSLDEYTTESALSKIIEASRNERIVIISENHLKPQHRIFALRVITELANIGFRHLGLEAFTSESNSNALLDSNLKDRGYPLDSRLTGSYTLEPKMGMLVRASIDLDYNLFAYESTGKVKGKDREEIQADNIIKYLRNHPDSKAIIVCGFHHAVESNRIKNGSSYWMAKYLKDKSGIDPLTVYQDNFTEKFIENEHPVLRLVKVAEPSVFVDKSGDLVRISEHVDIEVIHPKTRYVNGRPDWHYETTEHKSVKIELDNRAVDFPVLVSAYLIKERDSVPFDRFELKHKYDDKVMVLKTGEYRIAIYDGEKTIEYNQTVE